MAIDYELTSIHTKKAKQNCNLQKNTYPITAHAVLYTPMGHTHRDPRLHGRNESSSARIAMQDGPRVIVLDNL